MLNNNNLPYAGLAAGSIVIPNLVTQNFPNLFNSIVPIAQSTLPYCTGVCSACGGACLGSVGIIAALGLAAKCKRNKVE